MANSRMPGPFGRDPFAVPTRTPGPLGHNDAASPDSPDWLIGDTPAPTGFHSPQRHEIPRPTGGLQEHNSLVGCGCSRDISLDELYKVFSRQSRKKCEQYLPHINSTCTKYGITTCLRKAHFLAQVGHESGELRYTAEVLRKGMKESEVYDGYKGRGLIQITYGRNYKAYGDSVHHHFLGAERTELEEPAWATDSAGWYWTKGNGQDLNRLADNNDLLSITARVNGGFNGFEDRKRHLQAALRVLKVKSCKAVTVGGTYRPFEHSDIYNNVTYAFAWGCWNDAKSGKKGVLGSIEERRKGYSRFIQLSKELSEKGKKLSSRYGFSPDKMMSLAREGVR